MKGISDLLESDAEDSRDFMDENSILSTSTDGAVATTSKQKTNVPKKTKKRKTVTMPKSKSRVAKSPPGPKPAAKKTAAAKRSALEEHVNGQSANFNGQNSDEEIQETQPAKSRGRPAPKAKTKAAAKQAVVSEDEMEVDQTPVVATSSHAASRASKTGPKVTSKSTATTKQSKPVQKRTMREIEELDTAVSDTDDAMQLVEQPKARSISRQNSRVRQDPLLRKRAGSASDTERGDPNLRRKLGDVTRRFENVDLKYRNLKEVGVSEANANMEKLRRQCDATTQASNELISSLKKELAMQAPAAQDARKLKVQMQSQEAETNKLRSSNAELSAALTAAQNDIKALQAKLAAARSSSVAADGNGKTPVRDVKAGPSRTTVAGSSEAAQNAQMKEELYSDLTGLIVRSVKRGEDGDTYDCIQTGRNGTLHFKLFVDAEDAKTSSFDQTDFLYQPLLDANRDREMIELMPDYLTEEITFSRQDAAKFYGRVLDTLTKKRTDD